MKLESLVIAYQRGAVNTFSDLVHTARHIMEVDSIRRLYLFRDEDKIGNWCGARRRPGYFLEPNSYPGGKQAKRLSMSAPSGKPEAKPTVPT